MPHERPSFLEKFKLGRNMMLVIVSGVHSTRIWAFQESEREKLRFRLFEKDPTCETKFSDEEMVWESPSRWFQRTEPSTFRRSVFS